jgi:RHS repeat-associated protein
MGVEDVELTSSNGGASYAPSALTRYGLGARGIDVVSRTTSTGNTVSYPLYDAHGNNVGALSKSGSSFVVNDEKSYDAWGGLRVGINANGKAAYCANLGHKQDDESGLIYMRARYYEPGSGRFMSEDLKRDGFNYFVYCANNPVMFADPTGNFLWAAAGVCFLIGFMFVAAATFMQEYLSNASHEVNWGKVLGYGLVGGVVSGLCAGFAGAGAIGISLTAIATGTSSTSLGLQLLIATAAGGAGGISLSLVDKILASASSVSSVAVLAAFGRNMQCLMIMMEMDIE